MQPARFDAVVFHDGQFVEHMGRRDADAALRVAEIIHADARKIRDRERVKTRVAAGQVQLLAQPIDGGRHSEGLREFDEPGAGTGL